MKPTTFRVFVQLVVALNIMPAMSRKPLGSSLRGNEQRSSARGKLVEHVLAALMGAVDTNFDEPRKLSGKGGDKQRKSKKGGMKRMLNGSKGKGGKGKGGGEDPETGDDYPGDDYPGDDYPGDDYPEEPETDEKEGSGNENPKTNPEDDDELFDLSDCTSYYRDWLKDLSDTCESLNDLETCECTAAKELLEAGDLECAENLESEFVCPGNCAVCEFCMVASGCPNIYTSSSV